MAGLLDADSGAALVAGLFAAGEVSGLPGAAEISVEGHADRLPDCAAVTVHVRPGAALTAVGGRHGDALVVCLTGRPGSRRPRLFCGRWQRRSACRGAMSRW